MGVWVQQNPPLYYEVKKRIVYFIFQGQSWSIFSLFQDNYIEDFQNKFLSPTPHKIVSRTPLCCSSHIYKIMNEKTKQKKQSFNGTIRYQKNIVEKSNTFRFRTNMNFVFLPTTRDCHFPNTSDFEIERKKKHICLKQIERKKHLLLFNSIFFKAKKTTKIKKTI